MYKEKKEIKNKTQKSKFIIIGIIICCSLFDLTDTYFGYIITNSNAFEDTFSMIVFILFVILFSRLILGIHLYRHHLFGILLFFISLILKKQ